jgi:hypothetical protein
MIFKHFRDFLLVLNPNHGIFHPQFKAFEVGRSGVENVIHIGGWLFYNSMPSLLVKGRSLIIPRTSP